MLFSVCVLLFVAHQLCFVTFEKQIFKISRASFTKQGKLARERNSKTAPMGVETSAGDLLTTCKLKNTDATSHLHIDQPQYTKRSAN